MRKKPYHGLCLQLCIDIECLCSKALSRSFAGQISNEAHKLMVLFRGRPMVLACRCNIAIPLTDREDRAQCQTKALLTKPCIRANCQSARGGFLLDKLVGIALESIGLKPLEKLSQTLDAKQCRQTIQQLEIVEANEEPPQEVFQKEAALTHHAPLSQRLAAMVAFKSIQSNQQKCQQKIRAAEKRR